LRRSVLLVLSLVYAFTRFTAIAGLPRSALHFTRFTRFVFARCGLRARAVCGLHVCGTRFARALADRAFTLAVQLRMDWFAFTHVCSSSLHVTLRAVRARATFFSGFVIRFPRGCYALRFCATRLPRAVYGSGSLRLRLRRCLRLRTRILLTPRRALRTRCAARRYQVPGLLCGYARGYCADYWLRTGLPFRLTLIRLRWIAVLYSCHAYTKVRLRRFVVPVPRVYTGCVDSTRSLRSARAFRLRFAVWFITRLPLPRCTTVTGLDVLLRGSARLRITHVCGCARLRTRCRYACTFTRFAVILRVTHSHRSRIVLRVVTGLLLRYTYGSHA